MAITMQTSRKDNLLSIWSRIMHIVCFQINNVSQPKKTYWLWSFGFSMLGCCGIRHLIGTTYLLRIDRPNSYFAWPFHGQFPIHVLIVSCPQAQIFTYSTSTYIPETHLTEKVWPVLTPSGWCWEAACVFASFTSSLRQVETPSLLDCAWDRGRIEVEAGARSVTTIDDHVEF